MSDKIITTKELEVGEVISFVGSEQHFVVTKIEELQAARRGVKATNKYTLEPVPCPLPAD